MQHLANQVATALKLAGAASVREQLFRSEKLAAAGQLISEIANELRLPLESIVARASVLRSRRTDDFREELESIALDAQRASQIVARLDSLAKVEQTEVEAVDLTALIMGLLQFREPECKAKGVEIRSQLAAKPTIIMGSPGQLEQVLLNLLVDAEKSAADAREKSITVSNSLLARRMLVEIAYSTRSSRVSDPGWRRRRAFRRGSLGPGCLPGHYSESRRRVPRRSRLAGAGALRHRTSGGGNPRIRHCDRCGDSWTQPSSDRAGGGSGCESSASAFAVAGRPGRPRGARIECRRRRRPGAADAIRHAHCARSDSPA